MSPWCLGVVSVLSRRCLGDVSLMLWYFLFLVICFWCVVPYCRKLFCYCRTCVFSKYRQKLHEIASRVCTRFPPIKFSYGAQDDCIPSVRSVNKHKKHTCGGLIDHFWERKPNLIYLRNLTNILWTSKYAFGHFSWWPDPRRTSFRGVCIPDFSDLPLHMSGLLSE